jgi:hypothetical protein
MSAYPHSHIPAYLDKELSIPPRQEELKGWRALQLTDFDASMPSAGLKIRDITPTITTFSTPFNRFAPLGYRKFVAVGNRATAIRLHDGRILLLNPIQLEQAVRDKLNQLGGVHLVASDLGHHMYVGDYVNAWPEVKTIGVPGLDSKRKDVKWDYIYKDWRTSPEDEFGFSEDFETVLFEGFITYCVAWYHKPTKTLIQSDLMMNLPCTEVCLRAHIPYGFHESTQACGCCRPVRCYIRR